MGPVTLELRRGGQPIVRMLAVIVSLMVVLGACGGGAASPSAAPSASSATTAPAESATAAPSAEPDPATMPLEDLYELAKAEGSVSTYGGGGIVPDIAHIFEERFPGIKIENVDATAEDLVTRIITEAQGGRVLADIFQSPLNAALFLNQEGLVLETNTTEAAAYPDTLKDDWYTGIELQYLAIGWNTNLVEAGEEPAIWEDLADPKWKDRLMADPRDAQLLLVLALDKYDGDEQKAVDLFTQIAANNVEFQRGRRGMAEELLPAGQRAVCFTCNTHHFPALIEAGVPVDYSLAEGIAQVVGLVVLKDAPHPNAAMLFYRWYISEEGQQATATGTSAGNERIPALASVRPTADVVPEQVWIVQPEPFEAALPHYTEVWNNIFGIR